MSDKKASVSRFAYLGGLATGIGAVVVGHQGISALDVSGAAAAGLELALMAGALALTTGIWKLSAYRHGLDTAPGELDRSGE